MSRNSTAATVYTVVFAAARQAIPLPGYTAALLYMGAGALLRNCYLL